jgi:acetyltransferase EpsM
VHDSTKKVVLLGYSGHGYVVAEALLQLGYDLIGYADEGEHEKNPYNIPFLGDERRADFDWSLEVSYALGVGDNKIRSKMAQRVKSNRGRLLSIIHPQASISKDLKIGSGSFIARNVAVNPLVEIGENVILNTSSSIDHECLIDDNVHIAPGAVLAGNVKVGKGAFIGANSVVKEGVTIGKGAIIGAGSVVIRDVSPVAKVFGNPAHCNVK